MTSTENAAPIRLTCEVKMLQVLQRRIGEANREKGFHRLHHFEEGPDNEAIRDYTVARLALITTEVAEAIEEVRTGHAADETYYVQKNAFEIDGQWQNVEYSSHDLEGDREFAEACRNELGPGPHKPEGVPSELADIVIRALDFAEEFGIDLTSMIEEKLAYNATRGHKHGKVM